MFIQTEATPNPATLKFLPGRSVMDEGTLDIRDREAASSSPLAAALFSIGNVSAAAAATSQERKFKARTS